MFPTKTNRFIPIPKGTIVVAYVLIYARHEICRQISFLWQEGVLVHARYLQPTTGAIFQFVHYIVRCGEPIPIRHTS